MTDPVPPALVSPQRLKDLLYAKLAKLQAWRDDHREHERFRAACDIAVEDLKEIIHLHAALSPPALVSEAPREDDLQAVLADAASFATQTADVNARRQFMEIFTRLRALSASRTPTTTTAEEFLRTRPAVRQDSHDDIRAYTYSEVLTLLNEFASLKAETRAQDPT